MRGFQMDDVADVDAAEQLPRVGAARAGVRPRFDGQLPDADAGDTEVVADVVRVQFRLGGSGRGRAASGGEVLCAPGAEPDRVLDRNVGDVLAGDAGVVDVLRRRERGRVQQAVVEGSG